MTDKNLYSFLASAIEPQVSAPWIGHVTVEPNWGVVPDWRDVDALVEEFRELLDRFPLMALGLQGVDLDLSASKTLSKYLRRVTLRAEPRSAETPRITVEERAEWVARR